MSELVLIAAIELAGAGSWWLAYVAAVYFIGRVLHGFGLSAGVLAPRALGMVLTWLGMLGAGVAAIWGFPGADLVQKRQRRIDIGQNVQSTKRWGSVNSRMF